VWFIHGQEYTRVSVVKTQIMRSTETELTGDLRPLPHPTLICCIFTRLPPLSPPPPTTTTGMWQTDGRTHTIDCSAILAHPRHTHTHTHTPASHTHTHTLTCPQTKERVHGSGTMSSARARPPAGRRPPLPTAAQPGPPMKSKKMKLPKLPPHLATKVPRPDLGLRPCLANVASLLRCYASAIVSVLFTVSRGSAHDGRVRCTVCGARMACRTQPVLHSNPHLTPTPPHAPDTAGERPRVRHGGRHIAHGRGDCSPRKMEGTRGVFGGGGGGVNGV
jgi:hypothetical protein